MDMFSIISARRYIQQGGGPKKGREGFSPYLFIKFIKYFHRPMSQEKQELRREKRLGKRFTMLSRSVILNLH